MIPLNEETKKFSTVLVTGGAGFLGSQLVKKLIPISEKIIVLDDLSTGNVNAIPVHPKVFFCKNSVTNEQVLERILPGVEWIFHLSCRNLLLSVHHIEEDFHNNLYGGYLLLKKAQSHCPKLKGMVYTSTASVYGNAPQIPTPESYFQMTLPYSASKFSVEHYCQVFFHMNQLPVRVLRVSNVYGPGQLSTNPYCGVVAKFFEAIEKGEPFNIYGDGTQTRDFTFVEDVMDALILAAQNSATLGKVFNIGTGRETSILTLAETIMGVTGNLAYPLQYVKKRDVDKIYHRAVDPSLFTQITSWKSKFSLEEGLKATYQWLKEGKGNEDSSRSD